MIGMSTVLELRAHQVLITGIIGPTEWSRPMPPEKAPGSWKYRDGSVTQRDLKMPDNLLNCRTGISNSLYRTNVYKLDGAHSPTLNFIQRS